MKRTAAEHAPHRVEATRLAATIFLQMLPATLLVPAIRPLFATLHGGHEGAMHAFMALNMLGGILAAPWAGRLADRALRPRRLLAALTAADALLLVLVAAPLPTALVLSLRVLEGAAHVSAATLLLTEAAALRRVLGDGRVMGLAGAATMLAIALGSAFGAIAVKVDPRAPFVVASALAALVSAVAFAHRVPATRRGDRVTCPPTPAAGLLRALVFPVTAAFVERFTIGCIVVTFALFAHRAHGLSDSAVGTLFTFLTLPFALLTYPIGRLSDRVPRSALLAGGSALYGTCLALLGRVPSAGLPWVMGLAGCACAMVFAPTLCYAATLAGSAARGRAMSLVNAAGCLGMLLGPAAAGIISAVERAKGDPVAGYRAVFVFAGLSVWAWLLVAGPWLVRRLRDERAALRTTAQPFAVNDDASGVDALTSEPGS